MSQTTWNVGDPINYCEIVAQATAVARGGGVKNFFNVYHFRRTTTVNVLTKTSLQTAFQANIVTPLLAALNVDYTQVANTVRWFEDATDPPVSFSQTSVGGVSGDRLPDFNAAVIQLKSLAKGKSGRGSKHYGPIAESSTTGDDLTSGAVTLFAAVGAAIIAGFTDGNGNVWVPGIRRAAKVGQPQQYLVNPTTTVWTDISSYVLNKSLGTMKRRKIRTVT